MSYGFVLISTKPGKERKVYEKLGIYKNKEIEYLHPLFGEYDIIVKLDSEKIDLPEADQAFSKIGNFVVNGIRSLDDVIDTKTLMTTKTVL